MRLGLQLRRVYPGQYGNHFDTMLAVAQAAEEAGLDSLWMPDHTMFPDAAHPEKEVPVMECFVVLSAIAARTSRIRMSNDIALLPFYHPVRLAEELAVLDHISNGRMEFGIGMGYVPDEFRAFGVPLRNRVSMTEEAIEIMRLAWAEGPFSYAGKRYRLDNVEVHPKPVQPGGPPLWIAAMSEA